MPAVFRPLPVLLGCPSSLPSEEQLKRQQEFQFFSVSICLIPITGKTTSPAISIPRTSNLSTFVLHYLQTRAPHLLSLRRAELPEVESLFYYLFKQ